MRYIFLLSSISFQVFYIMKPSLIPLIMLLAILTACEGEINTNEDAAGLPPTPVQNDLTDNDDFFHAYRLSGIPRTLSDTLSTTDLVDYFYLELPLRSYRSYSFELKNLTGDADIELINAYLNKESWSDNAGTEDELIQYWRNYTDLDNNIVFIKVINRSGTDVMYTLEVN